MTGLRKITKFQTCTRHRWLDSETRRRRAEFFFEGGPAGENGCSGGVCRLWPGTDLCAPDICSSEYRLEWTSRRVTATINGRTYKIPEIWLAGWLQSHGGDANMGAAVAYWDLQAQLEQLEATHAY